MNGLFFAGIAIGIGISIVFQLATAANEEKQVRKVIRRMKKASLREKEDLKKIAKRWIDKL